MIYLRSLNVLKSASSNLNGLEFELSIPMILGTGNTGDVRATVRLQAMVFEEDTYISSGEATWTDSPLS